MIPFMRLKTEESNVKISGSIIQSGCNISFSVLMLWMDLLRFVFRE